MMAAERYFIYRGGGRDAVPRDATHVTIDESVSVIPAYLFYEHPNIVELICHIGVKRIEGNAFFNCPRLRRVIIPGVEIVEACVFNGCEAVTDIECPKLERICYGAFAHCKSLGSINLPSAKVIEAEVFCDCVAKTDAKFGKDLESIEEATFFRCHSLERITVPLKNGLLTRDDIFQECGNLVGVDLVEGEELHDTIDALHLEAWRNDMNERMDAINEILPNASAGCHYDDGEDGNMGEKTIVIRDWIARVLRKVIHYKAEHRHILNEAAATLGLVIPSDIVTNSVLRFLELPSHTFEGEEEGSSNRDESHFTSEGDDEDDEEGEEDIDNVEESEEHDDAGMTVGRKRQKTNQNNVDEEVR